MYDDVESDFWKEILVHMLHKNMVRTNAKGLPMEQCKEVFEDFERRHPELKANINYSSSYVTWELFISDTVKLRLYIQNQIKGSFMQGSGSNFVKIADAKFPNNPFPEIEECLQNRQKYLQELSAKKTGYLHKEKVNLLLGEFIKAHLIKKFNNDKAAIWSLEQKNDSFILHLQKDKEIKDLELSCDNYKKIIFEF